MKTFNYAIVVILLSAVAGIAQVKFTWTGVSGSWQTASNWNPNGVPGAADTAVVNSGTVTNDQLVTVASLFQTGGTINGTGNINISDSFSLTNGTHGGTGTTTITSTGNGSITGAFSKTISRMIVNDGSLLWSGATVTFSSGAGLTNNGTFEAQSVSGVLGSGGNGSIINNGTFSRTTGVGNAAIATAFINNGTTSVQSGTLQSTLSTSGSGAFVINAGNKYILSNGNHTLSGNTISGVGTLEFISGTLNLTGSAVNISSGTTFHQNGGTVTGAGGLLINGEFSFTDGTHGGTGTTTISSTGNGSITGAFSKTISRMIVNDGSLVWSGATVTFSSGAGLTNSGTFDAQSVSGVLGSGGNGSIVNNGTFSRTTGTGNAQIAVTFINNGTTNVQSGTLQSTLSTSGSGAFVINTGSKYILSSGNHTLDGNTISGGGTLELASGTLTLTGSPVNITSGTLFHQNGGIVTGVGGLLINGEFSFTDGTHGGTGTTTISSTGNGSITGAFSKTISRMIVNDGSLVWSGATVTFSSGAGLTNNGTFEAQSVSGVLGSGGNGSIINNGTFSRTTGTGNAQIATAFINNGTTNIQSGTLQSTLSTSGSGAFVINTGSKYILSSGIHTLDGSTISGGGTLELASGTLTLIGSAVNISSGTTFHQNGGTVTGDGELLVNGSFSFTNGTHGDTGTTTITSTGNGSITGAFSKTISRMIVNDGSLVWSGATVTFSSGAGLTNNGTFEAQSESGVLGSGGNGSIVNNGTFSRTTGTGNAQIATKFINSDELNILTGTLTFTDSLFNIIGGIIKGVGTMTTPTGNRFINDGTVAPGVSPGVLRISGNYPQTTSADLNIEIGGYQVGSERDSLFISGQAQLDGTLNIQFINNFLPSVGDSFMVMSYGNRVGQFSQINFSNNVSGQIQYLSNGVQILITSGGINNLPVAVDDFGETNEDVALLVNVLANDSDPDNDPITINSFTQPLHGSAVQAGDSSITYTPDLNFFGEDSLTYIIQDPLGATATAKVFINILPVNDPPTLPILLLPLNGDTLISNQTINFVWNASSDPENDPVSYAVRIWGNSLDTTVAVLSDTTLAFNNPNAFQQNNSYQWQVTTSDGNLSTLSAIRNFYIRSTAMAGVYTIGTGGDYPTIASAVEALETFGISGAVTFNILTGNYNEQIVLGSVSGTSSANKIIFQSQSGNPEDVMWGYSMQSVSSNYVVLLQNVSHLTFRNISFKALNQSAGRLIGLGFNTTSITIENNHLTGVNTSSSSNVYAIINSSDVALDSISIRNNKFQFGSFGIRLNCNSATGSAVIVQNNDFISQSVRSILLDKIIDIKILNNRIDNQHYFAYGVLVGRSTQPIRITENRIKSRLGILLTNSISTGDGALIANNFINVVGTPDTLYSTALGIRIISSTTQDVNIYYNTIRLSGTPQQINTGIWIDNSTSTNQNLRNNIIVNEMGGVTILNYSTGVVSNYNDLYTTGTTLVNLNNISYPDLASYQTATGQDLNSLSVNPSFISNQEPYLNDFNLNNAGTPLAEVTTDIDGEPRDLNSPDIGADEFEPLGFKGIYTIGEGGDFPTISQAVNVLNDTIVTGAVTFNILPGVYNEQVIIGSVTGVSVDNTVVFQSQSGVSTDVYIGLTNQTLNTNYVVRLNGARNITFKNLTFRAFSQAAGRLIVFEGNCRDITIENNHFTGIATTSDSLEYATLFAENAYLYNVKINGNFFSGGSNGIFIDNDIFASSFMSIENNRFLNTGYSSIKLVKHDAPVIKNNIIDFTSGTSSIVNGIHLTNCYNGFRVEGNRINITIEGNNNGIYLSSCNGAPNYGLVANNFIRVQANPGTNPNQIIYGIGLVSCSNVNVHNNSINITRGGSRLSSRALYSFSGTQKYFYNNILVNQADGYALTTSNLLYHSDFNDLYTTGSTLVNINTIAYSSLAAYQSGTLRDSNSVSVDPLFISDDDLHIKSGSPVDGKGTPFTEVPRDIDNQLRSLTTPDIGADEYTNQRIIIKKKNKLNKIILPLSITPDSLYIDPRLEPMSSGYSLVDVNISIDTLFHSNLADLEISLTHNGVTDSIAKFLPDSTSAFIGTILDDSGLLSLNDGVSPYTGSYRPHNPLSVFNGVDPEGEWVLEIYDRSTGNYGILDAWGLELIFDLTTEVSDEQKENIILDNFEISQNYPNPFNPSTTIQYSVPSRSTIVLKIYDILGAEVSTLVNEEKDAGIYSVNFNASQLASGVYLYRLQAGSFVETKKMMLLK